VVGFGDPEVPHPTTDVGRQLVQPVLHGDEPASPGVLPDAAAEFLVRLVRPEDFGSLEDEAKKADVAASGDLALVFVDRDSNGRVIGGKLTFEVAGGFYIPGTTGVHIADLSIRQGSRSSTGTEVFKTDLSYTNDTDGGDVDFMIDIPSRNVDVEALNRLLKSPTSFFVNMTANVLPVGLVNLRGQIAYFTEYHAMTVRLSPMQSRRSQSARHRRAAWRPSPQRGGPLSSLTTRIRPMRWRRLCAPSAGTRLAD
jgi:hypothetical protein